MRPWVVVVVANIVGCSFPPCPEGVRLTEDDLPCECGQAVVESLDCGVIRCGELGVELATDKGKGTTAACVSTSTYTEYSGTPVD